MSKLKKLGLAAIVAISLGGTACSDNYVQTPYERVQTINQTLKKYEGTTNKESLALKNALMKEKYAVRKSPEYLIELEENLEEGVLSLLFISGILAGGLLFGMAGYVAGQHEGTKRTKKFYSEKIGEKQ